MVENIVIERTAEGIIPILSWDQWLLIGFVGLIVLSAVGLLLYLIWEKITKAQNQDFYKDSYTNTIALCKNNCPDSMRGQKFMKAPDETHEGVFKGFIQGYNLLKFANKFYDVIVYNPKPFKFLDPSSWFEPDRISYMSAEKLTEKTGKQVKKIIKEKTMKGDKEIITEKTIIVDQLREKRDRYNRPIYRWHSPLVGSVSWYTIGTHRIGFFEYAVNDSNLTPAIVEGELEQTVGITATAGLLKQFGEIVGDALHSNPAIIYINFTKVQDDCMKKS